jgi:AbrB family looped-hinge helix DNA binding protein
MKLKIDRVGRIVLPKPLRDRLGLSAGSDLELTESKGSIVLNPVRQVPSLVRRNGLLIHSGKLPKDYDWSSLIEDERDDQLRKLTGL